MISIVMATHNRAHLLKRSLICYATQPMQDFELVIVDDFSTDDTREAVQKASSRMNIQYLTPDKPRTGWRDCAAIINQGIRAAQGNFIIATHPEVMVGLNTLQQMLQPHLLNDRPLNGWYDDLYYAAKIYYLTRNDQANLDTVNWYATRLAVRELPGFYNEPPAEILGPTADYAHRATDQHQRWDSWVFGGMTRKTWYDIGGFTEFETWGSIDLDFLARRQVLGIPTYTLLDPTTFCVHQNHDDPTQNVPTPRDMAAAQAAVPAYSTRESAIRYNL